jgi:hypothetical protein
LTTIAWDGRTLAADTLTTCNGAFDGYGPKIHIERGVMVGGAGSSAIYERFRDWVRTGMVGDCPLQKDVGNMFVIPPVGHAVMWCDDGPFRIATEKWALGSGENYALGAMEMGATAEQAVRVAMKHDRHSGGEVTVLSLRSAKVIPMRRR